MASSARFANQMNQFIEDRKTSIRLAQETKIPRSITNHPIALGLVDGLTSQQRR